MRRVYTRDEISKIQKYEMWEKLQFLLSFRSQDVLLPNVRVVLQVPIHILLYMARYL